MREMRPRRPPPAQAAARASLADVLPLRVERLTDFTTRL
jgi:hypothetical protein